MMKSFPTFGLAWLCLSVTAYSQPGKDRWIINGFTNTAFFTNSNQTTASVAPRLQYFVSDRLAVGGSNHVCNY